MQYMISADFDAFRYGFVWKWGAPNWLDVIIFPIQY